MGELVAMFGICHEAVLVFAMSETEGVPQFVKHQLDEMVGGVGFAGGASG